MVDTRVQKEFPLRPKTKGQKTLVFGASLSIVEDDGTVWNLHGLLGWRKLTGLLRDRHVSESHKKNFR